MVISPNSMGMIPSGKLILLIYLPPFMVIFNICVNLPEGIYAHFAWMKSRVKSTIWMMNYFAKLPFLWIVWYPLVNIQKNYGKSPCSMGKSTIKWPMFNSYVKLPEGNIWCLKQISNWDNISRATTVPVLSHYSGYSGSHPLERVGYHSYRIWIYPIYIYIHII